MSNPVKLLGISNAIVDILAHVDYDFLEKIGEPPGSMTLIDEARAHEIYEMMGPATEMSGGSVANTVAGFANLGGSAAYIGKVRDDQLGAIFNHDMSSLGIDVRLAPGDTKSPTARCHVLITPDGQRTMNTYLGACTELAESDISDDTIGDAKVVLLEGYVWDLPEGPALTTKAAQISKASGARVALSLSDSFCVQRHKDAFMNAVRNDVDIVLADEEEMMELFGVDTFDNVLDAIEGFDNLFVMTRSARGSVVVRGEDQVVQPADTVEQVIDTTGAGDAYSAGFLYGWAHDMPLPECARLATMCATNVIQQVGARIEVGLFDG